jgi:tetratricopeptide (TPR) repeat protein
VEESKFTHEILVVDDDGPVAQSLEKALVRYKVKVHRALDLESALVAFAKNQFDAVLVELEFAPIPGLALIQKWRNHKVAEKRSTPFIVTSGQSRDAADECLIRELGDVEILGKPFNVPQILTYLSRAAATRKRVLAFEEFQQKILIHYANGGNFEVAAEIVLKKIPEFGAMGLELLYDLYERANKFEEALQIVTQMLESKPSDIALINTKGRLLLRLKKYADAAVWLEKADALAPGKIVRLNEMAGMYLSLNRPNDAIKKFNELLEISPENPDLKFEMFSKLYECGFDDKALEFGKKTASPMDIVRHYNNRGVLLSKEGKTDEALIEYDRAIRFFPKYKENYRIYFNMAVAHTLTKSRENLELAAAALIKCLELAPEFDKAVKKLESVRGTLATKNK